MKFRYGSPRVTRERGRNGVRGGHNRVWVSDITCIATADGIHAQRMAERETVGTMRPANHSSTESDCTRASETCRRQNTRRTWSKKRSERRILRVVEKRPTRIAMVAFTPTGWYLAHHCQNGLRCKRACRLNRGKVIFLRCDWRVGAMVAFSLCSKE